MDLIVLQQLAVAFGLGLLLGLQRERAESSIGGIRTFPLIALFGTVCALLGKTFGGWVVAAGLLALVAIVVYSNFAKMKSGDDRSGDDDRSCSSSSLWAGRLRGDWQYDCGSGGRRSHGGALAVQKAVARFSRRDRRARHAGDYAVRSAFTRDSAGAAAPGFRAVRRLEPFPNMAHGRAHRRHQPHRLYRLQVSWRPRGHFAGRHSRRPYFQHGHDGELCAPHRGKRRTSPIWLRCHRDRIMRFAGTRAGRGGGRSPSRFASMAPPLAAILAISIVIAAVMFLWRPSRDTQMPEQKNPAELKTAFIFAAIYAVVLLAVAVAKEHFGSAGLYTVADHFRTDRHGCHYAFVGAFGGKRTHRSLHRLARDPDRRDVELRLQVRDGQLCLATAC